MADIRRDWLTNQNTHWCFVVIGLVGRQSHSPLLQLKIDPVRQMCPPYWLASSRCQRIFINIRGQYGIQKNIYIHPWVYLLTDHPSNNRATALIMIKTNALLLSDITTDR